MSKASTYETKAATREGKSYGYQQPAELAPGAAAGAAPGAAPPAVSKVVEQKQKVVSAFSDFMEALCEQSAPATYAAPPIAPGTPPLPMSTTPTTATPTTATGAVVSGAPSAGAGGQVAPATGEKPVVTEATEAAAREALEMSFAYQREAYAVDRRRETTNVRTRESGPTGAIVIGTVSSVAGAGKHTPDSNRSPLTETDEWASSYGALGKGPAPTIERMSVPSTRPESAPAPGYVAGAKPIDAYYGSFGTAIERAVVRARVGYQQLEVVIGDDDRVRVTNNEAYPWRCICSLLITAQNGGLFIGTGWLVAPRLVLTAGHCVYMSDQGGWASQIEVIPGRNAAARPYGSAISREVRSVTGWTQDGDRDYDYGVIMLPPDKRYGEQLGWFGYASRDDQHLRGITLNLAGYPGDGGKAGSQVEGSMWYHSRSVLDVMDKQITYEIDTYGGQSGAPVWELASNGGRYGVAIHTWGTPVNNGATRITSGVFDNIVLWAGQVP